MSARSVLDALAARTEPDRAEEAALPPPPPLQKEEDREAERGLPMAVSRQDFSTVACPKSPGSPSLAALLAESRAARHSLTEALSPRSRRRAEKAAASPPAFDLNAVAGALKQVEAETDRGRGPVRPRQASMPITPVSEEYAAEATAAGGTRRSRCPHQRARPRHPACRSPSSTGRRWSRSVWRRSPDRGAGAGRQPRDERARSGRVVRWRPRPTQSRSWRCCGSSGHSVAPHSRGRLRVRVRVDIYK